MDGFRQGKGKSDDVFTLMVEHQYEFSPYCSSYISEGTDRENLFNNQKLLKLAIICSILVTRHCDSGVIL